MLTECQGLVRFSVLAHQLDASDTFSYSQCGLERIRQTAFNVVATHQSINNDVNGVVLIARQLLAGC